VYVVLVNFYDFGVYYWLLYYFCYVFCVTVCEVFVFTRSLGFRSPSLALICPLRAVFTWRFDPGGDDGDAAFMY
jgi:hypothetical protein